MKKMKLQMNRYFILAASLFLLAACSPEGNPVVAPEKELAKPLAGELMIKFTPEAADVLEEAGVIKAPLTRSGVPGVDEVLELVGDFCLERVFPVNAKMEGQTKDSGLHLWYIVRFGEDYSVEEVAERLSVLGDVQKVSFNREIRRSYHGDRKVIPAPAPKAHNSQYPFNDDYIGMQWNIINRGDLFPGIDGTPNKGRAGADVQCEQAWEMSTGDPSIIVAILDEGIFLEHPDLKNNLWVNEDEIYRSHEDNDDNGYTGDVYGYNFVKDTGIISWDDVYDTGHASHVAGVIAARNNNGIGMASIAGGTASDPGVRLMSCQLFSGNLTSSSYNMIRAIKYAADNGAVVLQCSWGYASGAANVFDWGAQGFRDEEEWAEICPLEKEVLDYFEARAGSANGPVEGGVAIFAAGNEYAPMAGFPGAYDKCISVIATAADFSLATYSNYGTYSNIAAPGGDQNYYYEYMEGDDNITRGMIGCILSTVPFHVSETGYGYMEGTSMACPHVSGVVALGLSYAAQLHKHFKAAEIREMLLETASPLDSYMEGVKHYYRYAPEMGLNQPMQMVLDEYKGKMGEGQVNAARFLQAIADGGVALRFPNIYVSLGKETVVSPSLYFEEGNTDYNVSVSDTSVAAIEKNGADLVVKGLGVGMTEASISAGSQSYDFVITVREAAGNGWL